MSCIENYRRKGQELYASIYKDYVQVRNKASLLTAEYAGSHLELRERRGERKRRENRRAFVFTFYNAKVNNCSSAMGPPFLAYAVRMAPTAEQQRGWSLLVLIPVLTHQAVCGR